MKILIAEDDLTSRTLLSGILEKWGYEPIETTDGETAWWIMQQTNAPPLVILDWIMPGMEGLEVVRRVREVETERPPYIILLTSKQGKENIITGLEVGANDYMVKPFDPDELRARVQVGQRMVEIQERLLAKMQELQKAVDHIQNLEKILPICSFCKKIRDDAGKWEQVEAYVSKRSGALFSHGICPECMTKHYPDIDMDA